MTQDRRGFLRRFGVSTALVATANAAEIESLPAGEPPRPPRMNPDDRPWTKEAWNGDCVTHSLYDTIDIPKSGLQSSHSFFTAPQGKRMDQTNLTRAKHLDAPEAFAATSISIGFGLHRWNHVDDRRQVRQDFVDSYGAYLWLGCKYYFQSSLRLMFARRSDSDPLSGLWGECKFDIPIIFDSETQFYVELVGQPFDNPELSITAVLRGTHSRGLS